MKCPVCSEVRMREVEKNGVHIDVCPDCKGVWLDRGELDKLMSGVREVRQEYNEWHSAPPSQPPAHHDPRSPYYNQQNKQHYKPQNYPYPPYYKKKKKNPVLDILSDLF